MYSNKNGLGNESHIRTACQLIFAIHFLNSCREKRARRGWSVERNEHLSVKLSSIFYNILNYLSATILIYIILIIVEFSPFPLSRKD